MADSVRFGWLLIVAAAAGLALRVGAIEAQVPTPALSVIDAHEHADFDNAAGLSKLQQEWRDAGITGAVILRHDGQAPNPLLKGMNVVQCVGIGDRVDAAKVDADIQRGDFQCIKIYLGYVFRYAADPAYRPLYEIAARHHVPVVFHTGDTSSTKGKLKYADPLTIDEVAVDFPGTNFVIAHCGNPWIESAAEVAYKNPNVYTECSAMLIGDLSKMSPDKIDTFLVKPTAWVLGYLENPRKFMFGTDYPLANVKTYLDAYKKAIPREHWPAVFHDNAARLFHFPPA